MTRIKAAAILREHAMELLDEAHSKRGEPAFKDVAHRAVRRALAVLLGADALGGVQVVPAAALTPCPDCLRKDGSKCHERPMEPVEDQPDGWCRQTGCGHVDSRHRRGVAACDVPGCGCQAFLRRGQ